ncbi:hypothetical protein A3D76_05130 [Candidatus Roizmanbacteria bacterium RIFCSPHIGHO2_02_FULL_37_9b]|nr:MAG: hypothetical protein A3D76_05130 [Candidatus Roizmanbacteria bacterium RIFCSPHIGHO2_02_FULL_37_9b]
MIYSFFIFFGIIFVIALVVLIIINSRKAEERPESISKVRDPVKNYQPNFIEESLPVEAPAMNNPRSENKSFIASIVDSADDAIIGKSLDGRITSWNRGAEKLYGYPADQAIGQPVSIIFPPELKDDLPKILSRIKKGEHIKHYQTVRMDNTGRRIAVSITISPVTDEKGEIIGATAIDRDITQEMELDRLKDEFISLTSHALRTPLSAIKGLISMIYQGDYGPMNKNLEKPLSNISISTERLIQLVNDLLNISKIQTGKLEFVLTVFSVEKSISKVFKLLEPLAKESKIELKLAANKLPDVQADIEKTEEILNNLLSNALKFTNKGSVEVSLQHNNDLIWGIVRDTGVGIAEKDRSKLFRRFVQIANPTSKHITGTGLGLYLSKMLAQKMGGDVWLAASELKKGSTFVFSLPSAGSKPADEAKLNLVKKVNNSKLI